MISFKEFEKKMGVQEFIADFKTVEEFKDFLRVTNEEWESFRAMNCTDENTPENIFDNRIQVIFKKDNKAAITELRQIIEPYSEEELKNDDVGIGGVITDRIDNIIVYEYIDL